MKKILTLSAIYLFCLNSFSQSTKQVTVYKTDGTQISTSGAFIYDNDLIKAISFEKNLANLNSNNLENILKVTEGENVYLVKSYNKKEYLIEEIVSGVLSLYKGKNNYYLENNEYGLKMIPEKDYTNSKVFKSGIVSVFINNCNSAVNELSIIAGNITLQSLKKLISTYNTCDLQSEVQISDKVIDQSMRPDEKIEFGLTLGLLYLNTDYSQLIDASSTNIGMASFGAKVYFHTNFLNNNLDFNISADYFTSAKQQIIDSEYTLQSNTQFISTMIELNYVLNEVSPIFKPYFGISGGILFDSKSFVDLKSTTSGLPEINYVGNNEFIYNINIGTVMNVFNQRIDFLISYHPSINKTLTKEADINVKDTYYTTKGMSFKLTYIF